MKIEIDFTNQTIEVKDITSVGELIEKLEELNIKDWKKYQFKRGGDVVTYIPWYPTTTPWPTDPIYGTGNKPIEPPYKVTCDGATASSDNTVIASN